MEDRKTTPAPPPYDSVYHQTGEAIDKAEEHMRDAVQKLAELRRLIEKQGPGEARKRLSNRPPINDKGDS